LQGTADEELCNLYSSPSNLRMIKLRRMKWVEYVAYMIVIRNAYKILVSNPEWKRFLGRTSQRWEDSIKVVLTGIRQEGVDQIP
jgi:hypothetical protein